MNCPVCKTKMIELSIWQYCPNCASTGGGKPNDDLSTRLTLRRVRKKKQKEPSKINIRSKIKLFQTLFRRRSDAI